MTINVSEAGDIDYSISVTGSEAFAEITPEDPSVTEVAYWEVQTGFGFDLPVPNPPVTGDSDSAPNKLTTDKIQELLTSDGSTIKAFADSNYSGNVVDVSTLSVNLEEVQSAEGNLLAQLSNEFNRLYQEVIFGEGDEVAIATPVPWKVTLGSDDLVAEQNVYVILRHKSGGANNSGSGDNSGSGGYDGELINLVPYSDADSGATDGWSVSQPVSYGKELTLLVNGANSQKYGGGVLAPEHRHLRSLTTGPVELCFEGLRLDNFTPGNQVTVEALLQVTAANANGGPTGEVKAFIKESDAQSLVLTSGTGENIDFIFNDSAPNVDYEVVILMIVDTNVSVGNSVTVTWDSLRVKNANISVVPSSDSGNSGYDNSITPGDKLPVNDNIFKNVYYRGPDDTQLKSGNNDDGVGIQFVYETSLFTENPPIYKSWGDGGVGINHEEQAYLADTNVGWIDSNSGHMVMQLNAPGTETGRTAQTLDGQTANIQDGVWTSARLITRPLSSSDDTQQNVTPQSLLSINPGESLTVTFVGKLPYGEQTTTEGVSPVPVWPAFWMMGNNGSTYEDNTGRYTLIPGWPSNGEIDIMEARGSTIKHSYDSAVHAGEAPNSGHAYKSGGSWTLSNYDLTTTYNCYSSVLTWNVSPAGSSHYSLRFRFKKGDNPDSNDYEWQDGNTYDLTDDNKFRNALFKNYQDGYENDTEKTFMLLANIAVSGQYNQPDLNLTELNTQYPSPNMSNATLDIMSLYIIKDHANDDMTPSTTEPNFNGTFDGTVNNGNQYIFPSDAESWAGFSNTNTAMYPIERQGTTNAFKIIFTTPDDLSGTDPKVYFKLEKNTYPNNTPYVDGSTIQLQVESSDGPNNKYSQTLPLDENQTYRSFLMFIKDQGQSYVIDNIRTEYITVAPTIGGGDSGGDSGGSGGDSGGDSGGSGGDSGGDSGGSGGDSGYTPLFTGVFGGTAVDLTQNLYTYPDGSEPWGGFANDNATMYPLQGTQAVISFKTAAGATPDVYFAMESEPFGQTPDGQAHIQTSGSSIPLVSGETDENGDVTYEQTLSLANGDSRGWSSLLL